MCAMKMKQSNKKKRDACKNVIIEGSTLQGTYNKQVKMIETSFGSTILDTMKALYHLFSKRVNGMIFRELTHEQAPLNSQWLP